MTNATANKILDAHEWRVLHEARRLTTERSSIWDDLLQVGRLALLGVFPRYSEKHYYNAGLLHLAIRRNMLDFLPRWNGVSGAAFKDSGAFKKLRRATPDAFTDSWVFQRLGWGPKRRARVEAVLASPRQSLELKRESGWDAAAETPCERSLLAVELLAGLPERERAAITACLLEGRLHNEYGRTIGLTGSRVQQIISQGLVKLRRRMAGAEKGAILCAKAT